MKEELIFYTTLGCHLCDQAREVYQSTLNPDYFHVQEVEIAEQDTLIERYGTRIPVLKNPLNHQEIEWPFDPDSLMQFLSD
ncbi:glutaredoxin family protein [Ketobacter sp. MCCC 1A13808]|uniref:glutaredoxin family protein n=1 Tax=Ketobacter sp. MCCC 1A13808 TaxID=2602738 RepID=UPI000F0F3F57|nr:glutaredoxin family protein [Ketobacter sp. MCCC 1A13808]MVF14430.1 glutaredoxin family protein [Ketobacter sp. MCCC 1A13808]RLP52778.1 MAG: glutaredoxin family protein [Ketobacter sp.]